jgi:protein TonB
MKKPIGHIVPFWNLKIFLSISVAIHLLLFIVLIFIPVIIVEKPPELNVEVFFFPLIAEEDPPLKIIPLKLKPEFREQQDQPLHPEKREKTLSQQEFEPQPHLPMQAEEPNPPLKQKQEGKSETASDPESTAVLLPSQSTPSSEKMENPPPLKVTSTIPPPPPPLASENLDGTPLPNIDFQEELGNVSNLPSPFNGDIAFTPLENPAIDSWDDINKTSPRVESTTIPLRKGEGKTPSILTEFTLPKYAENPKPLYPQEAREKGYQGEVMLKVEVLANGRVGRVEVKKSSGCELLDRSASTAIKQWKFIPAKKGKEEISFWVNIPIKFQLK